MNSWPPSSRQAMLPRSPRPPPASIPPGFGRAPQHPAASGTEKTRLRHPRREDGRDRHRARLAGDARRRFSSRCRSSEVGRIVEELDSDEAADLLESVPEGARASGAGTADRIGRARIQQLLKYPADTAGGLMKSEYAGGARGRDRRRSDRDRADAGRSGRRHPQRAGRRPSFPSARRAAAGAADPRPRRRDRRRGDGSPGDLGHRGHGSGGSRPPVPEVRPRLAAGHRPARRAARPHHRGRRGRRARRGSRTRISRSCRAWARKSRCSTRRCGRSGGGCRGSA